LGVFFAPGSLMDVFRTGGFSEILPGSDDFPEL
jgi:hypothetical protein